MTFAVALAAAVGSGAVAYQSWLDMTGGLIALAETETSPDRDQAIFLARSTLMALNDANRSGNYSVLRDLAGPRFQRKNSAVELSETFRPFREANFDLSPAGMITPRLAQLTTREADGVLSLSGDVPMAELGAIDRIVFALEFEAVGSHWQLLTLSVGTAPAAD